MTGLPSDSIPAPSTEPRNILVPAARRPPRHTALAALPALALDLETTGLDVANDRIVQIGAVAMCGSTVLGEPRIDTLVDPGVPIPSASIRIHRITDSDVAGLPRLSELLESLVEVLAGRVVIGQNVRFDLAVLRHEAARAGVPWRDPPVLDVSHLAGALDRSLVDLSLDSLANRFGVTIEARHDALGDSLAAAEIFGMLVPRLREADVRTLGEAEAFAARRADLDRREAEAGWHSMPGDAPGTPPLPPSSRIDSFLYLRRLDEMMSAPARSIRPEVTLRVAARIMAGEGIGALLVTGTGPRPQAIVTERGLPRTATDSDTGPGGKPASPATIVPGPAMAGIVTERDLLCATTDPGIDLDAAPVASVMSTPVQAMSGDEMIYRALGRMDRLRVRHLCVTDASGAVLGMVSQRDLLHHRASAAAELGDAVACAGDAAALAAAHSRLPEAAAGLVAEGLAGDAAARVVSNEIRALTARAAAIAAERIEAEGHGPAPAPWCMLVLGSGGRGESLLSADQDNALVHAGSEGDDAWFAALGARLADLLDEAGVRRCQGGIMAANAEWRGNMPAWRERVDGWLRRSAPEDLLHVDIFYDLAPVAGAAGLGRELHAEAVDAAGRTPAFIALLAESVAAMSPPIGLFGRLRASDGRIDLKLGGLLPLVGVARTLALRIGSRARSTPERIEDAAAAGRVSPRDAETLARIHRSLLTMILEQQLEDLAAGVSPSGRIEVRRLSRAAQRSLARDLRALDDTLKVLRSSITR